MARLHALKDWSGLTYRELAQRASAVGDVLPRSTVANMLSRSTLPREELVVAFVRACGCGPDGIDSWTRVRKELTHRERQSTEVPGCGAGGAAADAGAVAVEPADVDNGVVRTADGQGDGGEHRAAGAPAAGTDVALDSGASGGASGGADGAAGTSDAVADRGVDGAPVDGASDPGGADAGDGSGTPAGQLPATPAESADPAKPAKPSKRALALIASTVVVLGAVLAALVHMRGSADDAPGPPQGGGARPSFSMGPLLLAPSAGDVFIRPAESTWCLGEPDDGTGRIFQVSCEGGRLPEFRIERGPYGFWRIESSHPVHGRRCAGTVGKDPANGSAFTNQKCGQRGYGEEFRIEPVSTAGPGVYVIRPLDSGDCMTLEPTPAGSDFFGVLRPCRDGRTGQLFVLERSA
ncbi:helix-turn-helix domain-containing protein [Streptomyces sp. NPDC003860]